MNILECKESHNSYLKDESKIQGQAKFICFPTTTEEVAEIVSYANSKGLNVTVQGSKTGITGGAVANDGIVMSLEKMNKVLGVAFEENFFVTLQSGVKIQEINENFRNLDTANLDDENQEILTKLKKAGDYVFLPQPTETLATIGGTFATNAKGINQVKAISVKHYVTEITVVTADGNIHKITKGENVFSANKAVLGNSEITLPNCNFKSIGIDLGENSDVIDLFIGTEGILGIITEVTIKMVKDFQNKWSVMFFFKEKNQGVSFASEIKNQVEESDSCHILAVEFFDENSLKAVEHLKKTASKLKQIPDFNQGVLEGVYLEIAGDEESVENFLMTALEIFASYNENEEDSWAGSGESETEKFKLIRHAVPEYIGEKIDRLKAENPVVEKVSCDYTFNCGIEKCYETYQSDLEKTELEALIFGHIFNEHFHVEILPKDQKQLDDAKALAFKWGEIAISQNGVIATENGIGKLKKNLVNSLCQKEIEGVKFLKNQLDPKGILNQGNII